MNGIGAHESILTLVRLVISPHDYHRLWFVVAKLLDANQRNYVLHLQQDPFGDTQCVIACCVLVVHVEESLGVRLICTKLADKNSINYSMLPKIIRRTPKLAHNPRKMFCGSI